MKPTVVYLSLYDTETKIVLRRVLSNRNLTSLIKIFI